MACNFSNLWRDEGLFKVSASQVHCGSILDVVPVGAVVTIDQ